MPLVYLKFTMQMKLTMPLKVLTEIYDAITMPTQSSTIQNGISSPSTPSRKASRHLTTYFKVQILMFGIYGQLSSVSDFPRRISLLLATPRL